MTYNVLLIEDDLQFKKLLELRIKSFLTDVNFTHCGTIASAKNLLGSNPDVFFDLVVLDQNLPDGKGLAMYESGLLDGRAVLAMSSDDNPEIPGANLKAGAAFFLSKTKLAEPLVRPLVLAIIERGKLERQLKDAQIQVAVMESMRTLVSTLRHEINNPLGAVLGGAFLLKNSPNATKEQREAAELVEQSGKRIKHVLEQIIKAGALEEVEKASTKVYQIPGDKSWEKE